MRESGFWDPGNFSSAIRNPANFSVKSGILGFGNRNAAQRIRNPYSTDIECEIREMFACGIRNPANFALETGILGFGAQEIRNLTNNWNSESKFH